MARNNVRLINYHTSGTTAPTKTDMAVGEIAVGKDLIWSKHNENKELSVFISSGAVHSAISAATTVINGTINALSTNVNANTNKFGEYPTSAETVAADTKTLNDAKSYTDLLKAKEGETYSGETLAGLKSEINSLKGNSDTSVEALAAKVTQAEGKITALEDKVGDNTKGLVKDVADLKTTVGNSTTGLVKDVADLNTKIDAVSGASSAYTDSQINAIKGDSYKTGTTLASLESNLGTEKGRIDAILQDAPDDLNSFKDVDTKIKASISSVYKIKGTKDTYANLPTEGNTIGDVYNVIAANGNTPAGTNYVCTASAGTREEQWDALGGTIDLSSYATSAITDGLKSRLDIAESDINTLTAATGTLNTSITTIQGWKINGSAITSDTVLNGTNLKVDATESAKTLKEAIADAASSGSAANNAFKEWTAGTYTQNKKETDGRLDKIDAYTVNNIKISENPVLTGENVLVGGTSEDKAKTLNSTIAEAKAAGTTAQTNLNTLKGTYSGTLVTLSNKVDANEQSITDINGKLNTVESRANSAIQKITIKANADAGVRISEPKGGDGEKTQELDFSAIVIDCGEF